MSELAKQIKLSDKTYQRLTNIGNGTYDDIVSRLLDMYDKEMKCN
jgi:hypothetical protein